MKDAPSALRPEPERTVELIVDEPGLRLDRFLADHVPGHSRAELQRWIAEGRVTVSGLTAKPSYRVGASDRIAIRMPAPASDIPLAEPIAVEVVYEDADVSVVIKPPGMVVHPAHGVRTGTLVNALLYRYPDLVALGDDLRPGIVHRLDKDTSGLIVVARNATALADLQAQFKARTVRKGYLALLEGHPEPRQARIEAAIGRDPRHRKRMAVFAAGQGGREAVTEYRVLEVFDHCSLVEADLRTGRTHQLRVHFSYLGHPVVGDTVYGRRKQTVPCPRQFLHAYRLALRLPGSGEVAKFAAPLPDDLRQVLEALASKATSERHDNERN